MKNYGQYHKVVVDGADYVHREYFIEQFKDRIKQNRDDFEGDEAQSAFDAAIKIINCIGPDAMETCSDEIEVLERNEIWEQI